MKVDGYNFFDVDQCPHREHFYFDVLANPAQRYREAESP